MKDAYFATNEGIKIDTTHHTSCRTERTGKPAGFGGVALEFGPAWGNLGWVVQ
jgi:hypothetical protein